jgi:hypothetical protein
MKPMRRWRHSVKIRAQSAENRFGGIYKNVRQATRPLGIVLTVAASFASPVGATEGGGSSYASGVNTIMSGMMPPPGLYGYVYLSNYDAAHTLDQHGNDKSGIENFNLHVQAASIRVDLIYPRVKFLGADVESRIALPYIKGNVEFNAMTPRGPLYRSGGASGFGDLTLSPLLLGWHGTSLHQIAGLDIFAPTGDYDKTRLFNPSRHYWAVGPWYGITVFGGDRWEFNGKAIYLFNFRNDATNYTSGQEFNLDYDAAYNINRTWQLGVSGYVYRQITNDRQGGGIAPVDGNKGQVLSIGPFVKFQGGKTWGVVVKWQHETLVRNRARGDRIWLQAAAQF